MYNLADKRIWVAGHNGMVGAAVCRALASENCEILTAPRAELDLLRQSDVEDWCAQQKPDAVIVCAARVGGILANDTFPADFIYQNLMLETNIIHSAYKARVEKLVFLGSSCIYPKHADQPMTEDALLTGTLEPTNEWYAIAKIAGIKLCQAYRKQYGCDFISAMPTNLYGPGDNFDLETSHVVPALLRKCHEAHLKGLKHLEVWGTGNARREFLYVNDCAEGIVFLLKNYSNGQQVNLGTGQDVTIKQLAELIKVTVGFDGELRFDKTRPDGSPQKLLDTALMSQLGWRPQVSLKTGLDLTYASEFLSRN
jgi:GDP-L-fucose synthase